MLRSRFIVRIVIRNLIVNAEIQVHSSNHDKNCTKFTHCSLLRTYIDVNECAYLNGGCQDKCVNMGGTYRCECRSRGSYLQADCLSCGPTPSGISMCLVCRCVCV